MQGIRYVSLEFRGGTLLSGKQSTWQWRSPQPENPLVGLDVAKYGLCLPIFIFSEQARLGFVEYDFSSNGAYIMKGANPTTFADATA